MNLHLFLCRNRKQSFEFDEFFKVFYVSVICILLNKELEFSAKRRHDSFQNKEQKMLTAFEHNFNWLTYRKGRQMLWLSEDKIDVEYQYAIRSLFFFSQTMPFLFCISSELSQSQNCERPKINIFPFFPRIHKQKND